MEKPQVTSNGVLSAADAEPLRVAPHGLDEIITVFGDIYEYIGTDGQLEPRWQIDFLDRVALPFPLRLSWDPSRTITQMTCHRRISGIYASVRNNPRPRAANEHPDLWRMLCLSPPADRQQTIGPQLGYCD